MPKKTNNKKRSPLVTISIIAASVLVLMLGGTYLYVSELDHSGVSKFFEFVVIDKSIKDKPVKEMITYTLPSDWVEDTETPYLKESGTILLKSGDYKENSTQWDKDGSGVSISLDVSPRYRFETLNSEKRYWKRHSLSSYMKLSDISIDGIAGIREEFSYNGTYSLEYLYIKDKYTIKVSVENFDRTAIDEKYWKDINTVLDSIRFK